MTKGNLKFCSCPECKCPIRIVIVHQSATAVNEKIKFFCPLDENELLDYQGKVCNVSKLLKEDKIK
jgi:hypothetical protein